jgi:hypothetical protein
MHARTLVFHSFRRRDGIGGSTSLNAIARGVSVEDAWTSEGESSSILRSRRELETEQAHSSYAQTKEGKVKGLLAGLCGFALSLALFLSGAAVATFILTGKPVHEPRMDMNQSESWTQHPRPVNRATQQFERLPDRAAATDLASREPEVTARGDEAQHELSSEPKVATIANGAAEELPSEPEAATIGNETEKELPSESLDPVVTASIERMPSEEQPTTSTLPTAHVEWCANRYRSYRPRDNSYTPFSGGRRTCISPYMDAASGPSEDVSPPQRDSYTEEVDDPSAPMGNVSADAVEATNLTQEHVSYCFSRYRSYRPEDNSYQPYNGGPRRQCR